MTLTFCLLLALGAPETAPALTDADRIATLERALGYDTKALDTVRALLDSPTAEYQRADAEFKDLDRQLTRLTRDLKALEAAKSPDAAKARQELEAFKKKWQLARDRFNLAIQERKVLQEKVATLEQKIRRDRQELARLSNAVAGKEPTPPPAAATAPAAQGPAAVATAPAPIASAPAAPAKPKGKPREALARALLEADEREAAVQQAQERVQALGERLQLSQHTLAVEEQLQEAARKKVQLAQQARTALNEELAVLMAQAPDGDAVQPLWGQLAEVEQRVGEAEEYQRLNLRRLERLRSEVAQLEAEKAAAAQEVEKANQEAEAAQKNAAWLEHPLHPANLERWALDHGPKLLAILAGMALLHLLVRVGGRRIVLVMARGTQRGTAEERQARAETLVGIFRNTATMVILGGGVLMLLESVGIPIVPLLGGAAVVGMAVAFGAQNLIRDYFAGFMVLMEDQYSVNDVVKIGAIAGRVETITLRVTVLRDQGGVVHFIPHGHITQVSNMTHGWSRAYFEIGVSYKEDVDQVMGVLMGLARDLCHDPQFGPLILEEPEMLGVDAFTDSAVTVKFYLKTRPLQQWAVKRELLRRIKHRFDSMGIEIPYPCRTVYHRYEDGDARHGEERRGLVA